MNEAEKIEFNESILADIKEALEDTDTSEGAAISVISRLMEKHEQGPWFEKLEEPEEEENGDYDGVEKTVKFHYETCTVCRGRGQYVNPNIDNQEPMKPKDRLKSLQANINIRHVYGMHDVKLEGYCLALSDLEGLRKAAEALTDYIEEIDESFEYVVFELAHALAKELQGWPLMQTTSILRQKSLRIRGFTF